MSLLNGGFAGGPRLGVALVQVTLVALLGLLAWLAARRGGPALRGAVLLAALVGVVIVPALAAVAPVWLALPDLWLADCGLWLERAWKTDATVSSPQPSPSVPALGPAVALAEPPRRSAARPGEMEALDEIFQPEEDSEQADSPPLEDAAPPSPGGTEGAAPSSLIPRPSSLTILAALWLLGVLAFLGHALVRLALLYRWARRARPVRDPEWTAGLTSLAARYGLPAVELRESPAVASPLTLGLFRPVILLPPCRRTWPAEQRALILAHELAHVRRRDFLAGLVAEVAACLCWFHPLVRWLAGRLRLEQEYTADAWAVSAANDATNYVRCLARLALELGRERTALAPAFWRRRPEILRRIDMLQRNPHGPSPRLGTRTAWTVAVLAASACVAVAGVGPLPPAPEDPPAAAAAPANPAPTPVNARPTTDRHGDPLPAGALARLGTTRWRHGANIAFVAFGADDQTLITAGQDNTARLWDVTTGKEIRRFAVPQVERNRQPVPSVPGKQAEVEAERARLEALIRQRAKPVEIKPPAAKESGEKGRFDAEKARLEAQENARLAAEKARLEALKAQLELQLRQPGLVRGANFTVAVAPDGKTLAVGSANVVLLYEVETGKELRKIGPAPVGVVGLLFSPDGRALAARGGDGGVLVWETATGKEVRQIKAPPQPENRRPGAVAIVRGGNDAPGMAFAPDGQTLAVATREFQEQTLTSSVKLWDVTTGKETGQIKGPAGVGVSAVAFAPGGTMLGYAAGNIVYLCDPGTGKELRQVRIPDGIATLVFSPDGQSLAVRGRGQGVYLLGAESGKELHQLGDPVSPVPGGAVLALAGPGALTPETRTLAFAPDGKRLATASGGKIRLWNAATGEELPLSDSHEGPLAAVALSADGKTVVSYGTDRRIGRWDAATGKLLSSFRVPAATTVAAFSPDGRIIALAGADNVIRLEDTATGKQLHNLTGPPNGVGALAFAPDGKVLAARGGDNRIRLYDVAGGRELRLIAEQATNNVSYRVAAVAPPTRAVGNGRAGLAFSPDGQLLASPGPITMSVAAGTRTPRTTTHVYDVATGKLVRKLESPLVAVSFAFSPDGRVLAAENGDQSITLWEVASGKERAHLAKVTPNPRPAAGGGGAALAGAVRRVAFAEPAGPVTLAFSPDGRALVARGPDLAVRVWDVDTGKEVSQLKGHEGRVETLAFSPDGNAIATGSADSTILLWDAATMLKQLPKHEPPDGPERAVEALWEDLAGEDAGRSFQSVLQLTGAPQQAVPFLGERLKPAARIDPARVGRWIADLESERYAVRQEAAANLAKTGEQAVPPLQKVLASQPTLETRKRVEELLDRLTGGTLTTEQLRLVRAVEVLERVATPEARHVLQTLAEGAPGALPTRQSKAALNRLARR
jgi:WD40 repeat protein/beta-lactamase regulating signal transducer with metallopeptidase domain